MKTKKIAAGVTGIALAVLLAACSQGVDTPGGQHVPSENDPGVSITTESTAEPTAVAVEDDNRWGVDLSTVDLTKVTETYGDQASALPREALVALSAAINEPVDLHLARSGDDAIRYEGLRNLLTGDAYERLVADATSGDPERTSNADGLVPVVARDGTVLTWEGATYHASDEPFQAVMVDTPVFSVTEATEAVDIRARMDATVLMTVPTAEGPTVEITRNVTLTLVPSEAGWRVDGWAWTTGDVTVTGA